VSVPGPGRRGGGRANSLEESFEVKIAIATDDGLTVSRHFGRAARYAVLTVEDGAVVARELRPKFSPHGTSEAGHGVTGHAHETGPAADARHDQMASAIADCQAVICGGMGWGAYERMAANGIRPIVTELIDVDEAALACAAGAIVDHTERLH
jgi:predicted Fe-Mo cluster-binding NifX family protein